MPQRYKLRLGDGTTVSVDQDGLRTWAGDGRAMAQAAGTQAWRPLQDVLAEEDAAARLARALIPPKPRQEPPTPAPLPVPQPTPAPLPAPVTPPLELPEFDLGAELPEPMPSSLPSLQVLADDPTSWRTTKPEPADVAADDMPIIPMKPLDPEPEFRSAFADTPEDEEEEDEPRQDRLDGPLLTVLETGGGFLSRVLARFTPLANRLTARTDDDAPSRDDTAEEPEEEEQEEEDWDDDDDRPSLLARVSGWIRGLGGRLRRPRDEEPDELEDEAEDDAAPAWATPAPAREPVAAPPPVSELPVIPFVESREPRQREDVYAGHAPSRDWNLQPVWDWTKRIVTTGALVGALAYAVLERDSWLPRTAEVGDTVFRQIDRQVLARKRTEEQRLALAAASVKLPELSPETIALIFSRSPTGIAEAGDTFQTAREAEDRGMGALTPAEADELRALAGELLSTLSRPEAERVREYDRTRARRVIFPFENPHVMELVARGARALPPERRERLQALSHKAIAAGLALPEATPGAAR